jgi:hypothetical protein
MNSRREIKVHVNRALRSRNIEHKLDEIALAIAELAKYVEDIEKDRLNRTRSIADEPREEHRRKVLSE